MKRYCQATYFFPKYIYRAVSLFGYDFLSSVIWTTREHDPLTLPCLIYLSSLSAGGWEKDFEKPFTLLLKANRRIDIKTLATDELMISIESFERQSSS